MGRGKEHTLDKIQRVFFNGEEEATLTPLQQKQMKRYKAAFSVWLDKPILSDVQIRNYLKKEFGISTQQAYNDIHNIKYLLGNINHAGKEWQRYKADQLISEAIAVLEPEEGRPPVDKYDIMIAETKLKAAKVLVAVHKLNKDEGEEVPWDDIIPHDWEPTSDPSVIGLKPVKNIREKIKKLKKKYNQDIDIIDTDYEEITGR